MKNLYQSSKLLTLDQFKKMEKAFELAWSKDTAFPNDSHQWSEQNKALGQCAPTALIVYDMFGGRIIYDKANFHLWNELSDGTQQDFSRSQFVDERIFSIYKYKTDNDVLSDKKGQTTNLLNRYELLKSRFHRALKSR